MKKMEREYVEAGVKKGIKKCKGKVSEE